MAKFRPATTGPTLNDYAQDIHAHNVAVGWWDDSIRYGGCIPDKYLVPTKLALIHSEVSEGLEGFRKSLPDNHLPHRTMAEVECGDQLIRIFDLAGYMGWDLDAAVAEKLAYNATREDHKREARDAPGGKSV